MTALVIPRPDMPGYNSIELDDVHTPSSDYSFYQAAMPSSGIFSFSSQTGPSTDLSGSSWDTTGEGSQNFQDFSDNGSAHPGDSEDFTYAFDGHITPRPKDSTHGLEDIHNNWASVASATSVAAPIGGEPMRRGTSRSSTGSQKHRTLKASSPKGRPRIASSLSQASSQMSHMDITGNASAFSDRSQTNGQLMDVNSCFLDSDPNAIPSQMFFPNLPMDLGMPDGLPLPAELAMHVAPGQMQLEPDASLSVYSPTTSLASSFSPTGSSAGSPDGWLMSSPPNSEGGSPTLLSQSPRNNRKLGGQELIEDDLSGSGMTIMPDDFADLSLPPSFTTRRPANEGDTAREHPLYKNATPKADGLFHCPWEGQASCSHKPEKLKCNYDKFVDSHLKPYRCKNDSCENARFSSTACLLRHEREAHAMHGHGDKPFLCSYDGCDRAMIGNGFPRQWNLKDHMRRVHNDNGAPGSPVSTGAPQPQQPSKSRKRKDAPKAPGSSGNRKAAAKASQVMEAVKEEPSARPLVDEWMGHHKALENILRDLVRPEDAGNAALIEAARSRLAAMDKISHGLGPNPQANANQTSYRRTFVPTG